MWDDEPRDVAVPQDSRVESMRQWADLDNHLMDLEVQIAKAQKERNEVRAKREDLGRKIAEIVYPSEKCAQAEPTGTDW